MAKDLKTLNEKEQQNVKSLMQMAYTVSGHEPSKVTWDYTVEQIRSFTKRILCDFVEDISQVTIEHEPKTGAIHCYAWINRNSHHLTDDSLKKESGGLINYNMTSFSPKMKELMDKFCPKNNKKLFSDQSRNSNLSGLEINLERIFQIELDINGVQFSKEWGSRQNNKNLEIVPSYRKGKNGPFDNLDCISVSKRAKNSFTNNRPTPKKSYSAI